MLPLSTSDGPGRPPTWAEMRATAAHAEAAGLDSVWIYDHFLSGPGSPPEGIHEAWTVMSALAATTPRVELGQLVMCVSFRNPALLAKMAATADAISGGRLTLGLGAGWYDLEYAALGLPTGHRVARFDEAMQIITPLLRGERVTVTGRYHGADDAVLLPPPGRRVPILVAATRPRMLALTARFADAWNTAWYGDPDERLTAQLTAMAAACDAAGRDPATLRRTVGMDCELTDAGELARRLDAYDRLGLDDVIVGFEPITLDKLDQLARAIMIRGR
jgi:alkanesulfonate monooxygenase SsuD/methylene tetrahydromethanopterin reductase-like flavin-dependent oxidoreductase (luciferase family)